MTAPAARAWHRYFPLGLALAVVALGSLPYLIGWAAQGAEHYTGFVVNYRDNNLYLAMLRQGLDGSWLYRLAYTSEPHAGAAIYVFFLALGHVARALALEPITVFHLARVIDGLLMLGAAWWLTRRALPDELAEQHTAFGLIALGSGLGWLALILGGRPDQVPDLLMPEAIPFYTALSEPHYPLALAAFLALTGLIVFSGAGKGDRGRAGSAGEWVAIAVLAALLALVKPYPFLTLFGATVLYLLVRLARERRVAWAVAGRAALAGVVALPVAAYEALTARSAPVIAEWWAADVVSTPSPPLWNYALAYAWVLAPAALGAAWVWRAWRAGQAETPDALALLYAVCWAAVNVPLLYNTFVPQRPLALGLQVPLALLAAAGIHRVVFPRLQAAWQGRLRLGWVTASSLTNLVLVLVFTGAVLPRATVVGGEQWRHDPRLFVRDDEWAGLMWLRANAPSDAVVMASVDSSVFIPAWAGGHTVAGHPDHTVDAGEKEAALTAFFDPAADAARQRAILDRYRVTYLWYGPRERALGTPRPSLGAEWREAFTRGEVTIFERAGGVADSDRRLAAGD